MPNLLHISVRLSGPYYLKSLGKGTENCVLLELYIYADYGEYVMQIVQAQGPCCNSKGRIIYHNHIRQLQQASCICWHKYLLFSGIFCSYIGSKTKNVRSLSEYLFRHTSSVQQPQQSIAASIQYRYLPMFYIHIQSPRLAFFKKPSKYVYVCC